MTFESLGLSPALATAAATLGIKNPNDIQREALPVALRGDDLLATARTGSGKTAAYALPLLQQLLHRPPPRGPRRTEALVVVPTRELAHQVGELLDALKRALPNPPRVVVAAGGVSINPQMMALRGGADLVVATPGRLLDLVRHNALRLDAVAHVVLDEADRLLDLGFADELREVMGLLPAQRQTLMFSATFPPALQHLATTMMRSPVQVAMNESESETDEPIRQRAILVDGARRAVLLRHLMTQERWPQVLAFVATQYAADHLARKLHRDECYATSFHGGLSQGARQQTLREFKEGRWDVVVTTDLAARGLHIDQLPVVVNFDVPRSAVDHTHRIGRTGRAGMAGLAITLVTPAMLPQWSLIAKRLNLQIPLEQLPGFETTEPVPEPAPGGGGIKGRRPSKKDKLRAAAAAAAAAQSSTGSAASVPSSADGAPATRG